MFLSCMIFLHFIDEKAVIATCFCGWLLIKYYYYYYSLTCRVSRVCSLALLARIRSSRSPLDSTSSSRVAAVSPPPAGVRCETHICETGETHI